MEKFCSSCGAEMGGKRYLCWVQRKGKKDKNVWVIVGIVVGILFLTLLSVTSVLATIEKKDYTAKDYSQLFNMPGFSETLLKNHFKLYQGYVTNTNNLAKKLKLLLQENKERTPEYGELKRRFGWEFNGMRLHELYFENLGGNKSLDKKGLLYKKIVQNFGSFEEWKKDFIATGMMRGIGWAILYYDRKADQLFNVWVNEHDLGHLSAAEIILVMDVFEHAYFTDYQLNRGEYIEAFFKNIKWEEVSGRFENVNAPVNTTAK